MLPTPFSVIQKSTPSLQAAHGSVGPVEKFPISVRSVAFHSETLFCPRTFVTRMRLPSNAA